ncbi:unnamed protein product [Caenorhabditis auriculariae]|uniref:Secreted protein n=1 Tax=Caenorhabditis auriculariae TaxID=2777116 RepID=A0A8S1HS83_9PELO|nr:unnamed protein product [Caenorhabditis auriculariae]
MLWLPVLLSILPLVASLLSFQSRPLYGFISPSVMQDPSLNIIKRYDRNCFFSPVQCMFSFNEDKYPLVVTPKGKRFFLPRT